MQGTGGGAVERAGLENQYGLRVIVGSNPTLSVDISMASKIIIDVNGPPTAVDMSRGGAAWIFCSI
jgi:hypothetical protein